MLKVMGSEDHIHKYMSYLEDSSASDLQLEADRSHTISGTRPELHICIQRFVVLHYTTDSNNRSASRSTSPGSTPKALKWGTMCRHAFDRPA